MKNQMAKADFGAFTKIAQDHKEKLNDKEITNESSIKTNEFRYLQVRLTNKDANRLKASIVSKGLSVQSVLVEAINRWMQEHNQPPLADPGTGRKK